MLQGLLKCVLSFWDIMLQGLKAVCCYLTHFFFPFDPHLPPPKNIKELKVFLFFGVSDHFTTLRSKGYLFISPENTRKPIDEVQKGSQ